MMAPPKQKSHSRANVHIKKRNPKAKAKKRNPADSKALASAKRLSKMFHGSTEVVELSAKERKPLPRYVVVAGQLDEFTYAPGASSKRGAYKWSHKSGDKGPLAKNGKAKPLLVVDPATKRPAIVANRSGMRFSSKRGFVG